MQNGGHTPRRPHVFYARQFLLKSLLKKRYVTLRFEKKRLEKLEIVKD